MAHILKNLSIAKKLFTGFAVIVAILLILSVATYINLTRFSSANDMNVHTYKVISELQNIIEIMVNMETGQRGFSITGDEKFLDPYNAGKADFDKHFDSVKGLTSDNPKQQENLQKIKAEKDSWLQAADKAITLRKGSLTNASAMNEVINFEKAAQGKTNMDNIRSLINASIGMEQSLLQQRSEISKNLMNTTDMILLFGTLLAILLAVFISFTVTKIITGGIYKVTLAAQKIAKGELDIDVDIDSKDEVGKLAATYKIMVSAIKLLIADADILTKAALEGRMATRADVSKHSGDFKKVVEGMNNTLDAVINPMDAASKYIAKMAKGEELEVINNVYKGDFATLIDNLNLVRASLYTLLDETGRLAKASLEGQLSVRGDITKLKGGYADIVKGVNDTLDAVIEPVNEASAVLNEMVMGNLKARVKGSYKGDHAAIKDALNNTMATVSSYIDEVADVLNEMANGNMDVSISRDYVGDFVGIKDSLNNIIEAFNKVLKDINSAAEQVASGARQVSDSSQELSQGSTEQASSIEELTASIEEIATQTRQNAANANQANELALSSKDGAVQGNEQMKEMLKAMSDINEASGNISKIIKVIDEIAFQTNILALNAAVEAARAGQHGKGFAVVAEEVRNLAARSANAAKETTVLIEGSIKKVEDGTKIANETANALNKIVDGVTKATTLVGEIAAASNEQAAGIAQVNQGISQVSQVTQANSATSEESAAASEELSGQAEMLKEMVGKFRLKRADKKFDVFSELNPEVLKLLENISEKKRNMQASVEKTRGEAAATKPKIKLSDREFGKY